MTLTNPHRSSPARIPYRVLALLLVLTSLALPAVAQDIDNPPPLTLDDISGRWHGSAGDLRINFSWTDTDTDTYASIRQRYPSTSISASVVPVPDAETGAINLRLDYMNNEGRHSEVIAVISRGANGTLTISVLPAAVAIDQDYRVVVGLELRPVE